MPHRKSVPASAIATSPNLAVRLVGSVLLEDAEIPPVERRAPYAVERHAAPRGWVKLVGYDGQGEFFSDWTIPSRKYTEATPSKFRRWLIANDDREPTTLSLLPG